MGTPFPGSIQGLHDAWFALSPTIFSLEKHSAVSGCLSDFPKSRVDTVLPSPILYFLALSPSQGSLLHLCGTAKDHFPLAYRKLRSSRSSASQIYPRLFPEFAPSFQAQGIIIESSTIRALLPQLLPS